MNWSTHPLPPIYSSFLPFWSSVAFHVTFSALHLLSGCLCSVYLTTCLTSSLCFCMFSSIYFLSLSMFFHYYIFHSSSYPSSQFSFYSPHLVITLLLSSLLCLLFLPSLLFSWMCRSQLLSREPRLRECHHWRHPAFHTFPRPASRNKRHDTQTHPHPGS